MAFDPAKAGAALFPEEPTGEMSNFDPMKADAAIFNSAAVSRQAAGANAAQESAAEVLARKNGLQPNTVRERPEDAAAIDLARRIDGATPVVRASMQDVEFAKQAKDDIENLSSVEKALIELYAAKTMADAIGAKGMWDRMKVNLWPSIKEGVANTGRKLSAAALDASGDRLSDQTDPDFPRQNLRDITGLKDDTEYRKVKNTALQGLHDEIMASDERVEAMTPKDLTIVEEGFRSGVISLATQAPAFVATLLTRNPAFALGSMSAYTGINSYGDARVAGKEPPQALLYGGVDAAIEYWTEKLPTKALVDSMGPGWKKALADFAVGELVGEQAATLGQSLNAVAHDLDKQWEQADGALEKAELQLRRQAVTFVSTLVAGGSQAGAARAIGALQNRIAGGESDQLKLAKLTAAINESGLRKSNPAKFAQLLKRMGEANSTDTVYIDADRVDEFFQGNVDIEGNASLVAIRNQIAVAQEDGSRLVAVPLEAYADIVGSDFHTAMAPHMKLDPDALTPDEAMQEDIDARIEALVVMDQEEREASAEVYNEVLGQLLQGGDRSTAESYAMLWEATFQSLAARPGIKAQGLTALDLYRKYNPTIQREVDPRVREQAGKIEQLDIYLDRLRAGDYPRSEQMFGATLTDFIAGQGGLIDDGGELSARDAGRRIVKPGGRSLDDMAELAVESGYITERPPDALLEAIDNELRGKPVYATGAENSDLMNANRLMEELGQMLDESGLDVNEMTNAEIKAALQATSEGMLDQPGTVSKLTTLPGMIAELLKPGVMSTYGPNYRQRDTVQRIASSTDELRVSEQAENAAFIKRMYDQYVRDNGSSVLMQPYQDTPYADISYEEAARRVAGQYVRGEPGSAGADQATGAGEVPVGEDEYTDPDLTLYQQDGPRLSAIHSLTSENLLFADNMGGLAVPSIAVVKEGMAHSGYGEITLIGTEDLGNPEKVTVYDSDAYTSTFPRPEYPKVKSSTAQSLVDAIRDWVTKYEGKRGYVIDATWDYAVNNPNPEKVVQEWMRSNGIMAMFLDEVGAKPTKVAMTDAPLRYPESKHPAVVAFFKEHSATDYSDESRIALAGPLAEAIRETYKDIPNLGETMVESAINDDGAVRPGVYDRLLRDSTEVGKRVVDEYATSDRLNKKLKGKEAEFQAWVNEKVMAMYGDPYLKVKGKKQPYTLDNIVEYMTHGGTQAKEKNMTFGEGMARATAAQKFTNLGWMRNAAEWQILPESEIKAGREKAQALMEAYREAVIDYYTVTDYRGEPDTWGGLDASMKAMADWAKTRLRLGDKAAMKAALRKNDFKGVPDEIVQKGTEAGQAMMSAPLPYFEAKPERAVNLDEFVGAVVPDDVSQDVLDVLDKHGIRVQKYGARYDEGARESAVGALTESLHRGGSRVLFQPTGKGPRGSFNPATNQITLTPNADLSTFLHESAHFFLEVMRDLAPMDESLQADLAVLEKWWGDADYTRRHEMFASGFETYLMEGKAPTPELQSLFSRFAIWLGLVYKRLSEAFARNNLGGVQLSDEVRGVMDRLVATQEAIAEAQQQQEFGPLNYEQLGLSPEQAASLQEMATGARDEALKRLTAEAMREYQRDREGWWKAQVAARSVGIREEMDQLPEYLARDFLSGDRIPEGVTPFKLDLDYIRQMYGKTPANRMKNMAAKGGMHPDLAAPLLGFSSGDALVQAILGTRNKADRAAYVKAVATESMRAEHGDILTDGSMAEKAENAVHNDKQAEVLLAELRLLNRAAGLKETPRQLFKAAALQYVAETPIHKLRPDQHKRNEAKARQAALRAAIAGDTRKAALESHRALRQFYLYRETMAAKQAAEVIADYARSFKGKKLARVQASGDHFYGQLVGVLEKFEFRAVSDKGLRRRDSMRAWIETTMAQAGEGNPFAAHETLTEDQRAMADQESTEDGQGNRPDLGITDAMLAEAGTRNYRTLTLVELEAVRDALRAVDKLSLLKNRLLTQAEKRELNDWVEDLIGAITRNAPPGRHELSFGSTRSGRRRRNQNLREFQQIARTPTSLIKMLDGYENNGIAWQLLGAPMQIAAAQETEQLNEANKALDTIFSRYSTSELNRMNVQYYDRRINDEVSHHDVVSILLNWGNAGGRQRVVAGFDIDESTARYLMDTYLTEKDYLFAKDVWAHLETYKGAAFELHRDLFGFTPPEVEALPFQTQYGMMPGGYYPIKYDQEKSAKAEQHSIAGTADPFVSSIKSKAKLGSNQARVARVKRALDTDMARIIFGHVADVIHQTTHDRALYDVGRLLASERVKHAITDAYGAHIYKQLTAMVRNQKEVLEPAKDIMDRVVVAVRNNATLAMLGASLRTVLLQPFGATNSFVKARMSGIGAMGLVNGYARYMADPAGSAREIRAESLYMKNREQVQSVAISRIKNKLRNAGKWDTVKEATMVPIVKMQFYAVDAPLYLAARDHFVSIGIERDIAIGLAEQVVRDAQGGGGKVDTAEAMMGPGWKKLFTNFLTYSVTTYNLQAENYARTRRGQQSVFDFAVNTFVLMTMPSILMIMLNSFAQGGGDDDDEDSFLLDLTLEQASFILSMNPLLAQFAGGLKGYDYAGPQGTAIVGKAISLGKQTAQGEVDESLIRNAIWFGGLATGLPAAQLNRTIFGLKQAAEQDDGPLTTIKKAAFGPERNN